MLRSDALGAPRLPRLPLLLLLAGCAAPTAPPPFDPPEGSVDSGCPPTLPLGGSACAADPASVCSYGVTECAGSTAPTYRRCVCADAGWTCGCASM